MVVQSRSPNTTFDELDVGNEFDLEDTLLPRLLRVNKPSAPDETLIAPKKVEETVLFVRFLKMCISDM